MTPKELKRRYFEFFVKRGHSLIKSSPLIPEHDPTVLFTTAGMHPLVPYLMGQPHPLGKRLVNAQKCIRTGDIDEVGDSTHLTFFEMLGNWSLGDYFKKEAITYSFDFLTKELKIPLAKLAVSCFSGDNDAPKDSESAKIWASLGIPLERIAFLPKENNWWGPAGLTGPCGPDTEMFFWCGKEPAPESFEPEDPRWIEIWNDVLMQFVKDKEGNYKPAEQQNVDTGMGLERTIAMLNSLDNVFETELFKPIMDRLMLDSKSPNLRSMRIVSDHLKAAAFILAESIAPSNLDQGYVLRRLIRRSIRHLRLLGIDKENYTSEIALLVIDIYKDDYPELGINSKFIFTELENEENKFKATLEKGLREFTKITESSPSGITGKQAFLLFQSYGFPLEMTEELAKEKGVAVNRHGFLEEFEKHQQLSRVGAEKRFKGGLADSTEQTKRLHTATHLLNQALRIVLNDKSIHQKGSNITPERLRFDFNFHRKLSPEEVNRVELMVNEKINEALPVSKEELTLSDAKKSGVEGVFEERYSDRVWVYSIGSFSREICGGPHVENASCLGRFRILKEESSAAGIRRIKAVLE